MSLPKMKFVTYQVQELYSKRLREGYKKDSTPCCLTQKYFKTSSCGGVLFKVIFSFLLLHWSEILQRRVLQRILLTSHIFTQFLNLVFNCLYWSFKFFIFLTMVTYICQLLLYILNNFFTLVNGCWDVQPKYQKKGVDFSKTFYHHFY